MRCSIPLVVVVGFAVASGLALVPTQTSADTSEAEGSNSTLTRENHTFIGADISFKLDRDVPGIRDLTSREAGRVIFETIRPTQAQSVNWTRGFDTFTLSAGDGFFFVQDHAPPPFRVWFPASREGVWELTVAAGVSVERLREGASDLISVGNLCQDAYELEFGAHRKTHLCSPQAAYNASTSTFTVRNTTLVGQLDRVAIEANEGDGCPEHPMCMRTQGFLPHPQPGDRVRIAFTNSGNATHSLWVADRDEVANELPNPSRDEAFAGVGSVPPGEHVSLNLTIPNGTETLYFWSDRSDDAEQGMWWTWNLVSGTGQGDGNASRTGDSRAGNQTVNATENGDGGGDGGTQNATVDRNTTSDGPGEAPEPAENGSEEAGRSPTVQDGETISTLGGVWTGLVLGVGAVLYGRSR